MKNKLEVGMYVRTKRRTLQPPQIARIRNISKDSGYKNQRYIELDKNLIPNYEYHIYEEDVLKPSHNIIDLIEVGDYVNGYKITKVENKDGKTIIYRDYDSDYYFSIEEEDIKSIVTKEQFESISYKVGD